MVLCYPIGYKVWLILTIYEVGHENRKQSSKNRKGTRKIYGLCPFEFKLMVVKPPLFVRVYVYRTIVSFLPSNEFLRFKIGLTEMGFI